MPLRTQIVIFSKHKEPDLFITPQSPQDSRLLLNKFWSKLPALILLVKFIPFLFYSQVDAIKKKRFLLDMARLLTNDSLKKISDEVKTIKYKPITKMSLEKRIAGGRGYSNFNDIFMVSALDGMGVDELRVSFSLLKLH